ncbi:aminomethyl-transferring glycine dehydrogenase subunit GcvPB [Rhodobiaceae bacterium]|nr:aminomethyl-transferring glycine dehydrogenase subunit GcvPB [Rhodobiaceae bacterium]
MNSNRGLDHDEKLLFEVGDVNRTGVDLSEPENLSQMLGDSFSDSEIGLAGLSEPETVRHYVRLSRKNYSIDAGLYPLGSCTMKHNPRLNEKMARLEGFSEIHPLQPISTCQGALELIDLISSWLKELTGMAAVTMTPKAGAQGELCGMMAIKQALLNKNESHRKIVLVPDSAHGTNPATAAFLGFEVKTIKSNREGLIDFDDFKKNIDKNFAGVMITNPNTCGLFETDIVKISELTHKSGGYLYCDGANFNAVVGKLKPGDLGIDAMHINLHKTFSTPHGGGGPGSGPVVFSERLEKFCPTPLVENDKGEYDLIESLDCKGLSNSFGRLNVFHGQMGMFVRAMSYMLSHGADGLRQVSEDAVLNANYLRASLNDRLTPAFEGYCMHEILFSDDFLKDTGVETLDFAKAMIDEGYHPMTIYFPLVIHGALLVEPTETESKQSLDHFISTLRDLVDRLKEDSDSFKVAPVFTPIRRLDETQAARKPILRWKEEPLIAV